MTFFHIIVMDKNIVNKNRWLSPLPFKVLGGRLVLWKGKLATVFSVLGDPTGKLVKIPPTRK